MTQPEIPRQRILIAEIDPHPLQPRRNYDPAELDELAESISAIGLISPITVQRSFNRYVLITGSRRLAACALLNLQFIDSFILPADYPSALNFTIHENLFRADLSPLEEGLLYHRLIEEQHLTPNQIAHASHKPESYVTARLALVTLDDYLRNAVDERSLPISHALELAKIEDPEQRKSYTHYAISSGASLNTVRYWRQQVEATKGIPTSGDTPPHAVRTDKQQTTFGWYCCSCNGFSEAQLAKTLHFCPQCAATLLAKLQELRTS